MIITRQMLRDWKACYDDDKIAKYVPEEGLTPLQVLDLDIPHADRRWVVMREAVIPTRQRIEIVCVWAERALSRIKTPDPRSVAAIEITRRYARGEATLDELRLARSAATTAAAYAADAAAAAAYADVAAAAAYAAYAADAAAAAAYADAAAADARRQERDQQIDDIRRVLRELDGDATWSKNRCGGAVKSLEWFPPYSRSCSVSTFQSPMADGFMIDMCGRKAFLFSSEARDLARFLVGMADRMQEEADVK